MKRAGSYREIQFCWEFKISKEGISTGIPRRAFFAFVGGFHTHDVRKYHTTLNWLNFMVHLMKVPLNVGQENRLKAKVRIDKC